MDVIVKEIIEEIGDMHSSKLQAWFESIGPMVSKIESLEAIIEGMEAAEANATFQLVTELPSTGKQNTYYIMLDSATGKYEEYSWNGSSFDKVGTIGDEVQPAASDNSETPSDPDNSETPSDSDDPSAQPGE